MPQDPPQASPPLRFFIAGIMQGSLTEAELHDQDYRGHLADLLAEHFPDSQVYDPLANHSGSIKYDDRTGREVFFGHNRMCRNIDVLVAFVPEASMGTAIEMWEAYTHGAVVITISPLAVNWAVRFLSHVLFEDVGRFEAAIVSGDLARQIEDRRQN
ncbi:MAG: hypothetical protein U9N87_04950 [Planctomycetota bacterium]|nr:hypothetical protein [Planctomycetota bacterium]